MGFMSIINNIRKRGAKDILNPARWTAYTDGNNIRNKGITLQYDEIVAYSEQVVYRKSLCGQCFEQGSCTHCGCVMPLSGVTPSSFCSGGNWDKMMRPEEWEKFKQENDINLGIL